MSSENSLSGSGQPEENREDVMPDLGLEVPDLPESVWLRVIANALDPDAPPVADDIVPDTFSETLVADADHSVEFFDGGDADPADQTLADADDDGDGGVSDHGHSDLSHDSSTHSGHEFDHLASAGDSPFEHSDFSHGDFAPPNFVDPDLPTDNDGTDSGWSN